MLLSARRCRSISPVRTPLLRSNGGTDGRTDGRTLNRFIDPAPRTMQTVSKVHVAFFPAILLGQKITQILHATACPVQLFVVFVIHFAPCKLRSPAINSVCPSARMSRKPHNMHHQAPDKGPLNPSLFIITARSRAQKNHVADRGAAPLTGGNRMHAGKSWGK